MGGFQGVESTEFCAVLAPWVRHRAAATRSPSPCSCPLARVLDASRCWGVDPTLKGRCFLDAL